MFKRLWSALKEWTLVSIILGLPIWIIYFLMCNSIIGDEDPDWWKFWKLWKKDKPEEREKNIDDVELWDLN